MKGQTKVPTESLMGNKPIRSAAVQKVSQNRGRRKLLEDVYSKNETINKKQEEDLKPKKLGIQYRK